MHPEPVHPRVCGEHGKGHTVNLGVNGSSPRVRGTPPDSCSPWIISWFIPACAGNTRRTLPSHRRSPVHPRVCGEHDREYFDSIFGDGSSPRVRGTPPRQPAAPQSRRFIPACAGNTPPRPPAAPATAVHPRVCGEHTRRTRMPNSLVGSSPRVRGTRDVGHQEVQHARFIPACAGNTPGGEEHVVPNPVHPRVCGEHAGPALRPATPRGSSPRVRGTRTQTAQARSDIRFIPACAGNTMDAERHILYQNGSSPRVRGTLAQGVLVPLDHRFIPACAGNTTTGTARCTV